MTDEQAELPTDRSFQLFHLISDAVGVLHRSLAANLFARQLRQLTDQISELLLEQLILRCTFNEPAVRRLSADLQTGLLPLFRPYLDRPEEQFIELVASFELFGSSSLLSWFDLNTNRVFFSFLSLLG